MIPHRHNTQPAPRRHIGATAALCIMVVAGLVQVLAVTLDHYQDTDTAHSVTEDALTTRRSLHLAAVGLQSLMAANGVVANAEMQEELMAAGAAFEMVG